MVALSQSRLRPIEWCIGGLATLGAVAFGLASGLLAWWLVVAGLVVFTSTILILRRPWWGVLAIIFFLPFERLGAYELGGLTIRATQLLLFITAIAFMIQIGRGRSISLARNPVLIPLAAFFGLTVLSLPHSPNLTRSLAVFAFTLFTASLAFFLPNLLTNARQVRLALNVLLISFVLVAGFGLFQFLGDMSGLPTTVTGLRELYTKSVLGFTRVQSTAYEPLYFANYLLLPLSVIFALYLGSTGALKRGWLLVLFALGMVNIVLTVSRGGYLAVAVSILVIGLCYARKFFTWQNLLTFAVAVVAIGYVASRALGVGGGLFTMEKFQEHVGNAFYGASYDERVETFGQALTAWHEQPWFGIGIGAFGPYVAPHPSYMPKDGWRIVNNEFLEILAEQGLLGLLAFIAFYVVLLVRSMKAILVARDPWLRAVVVALMATVLGMIVQYQTFSTLYIVHVWFSIGLLMAVQEIIFREYVQDDHPVGPPARG